MYESILTLYNYERSLYNKLTSAERDNLHKKLLISVARIENEADKRNQGHVITKIYEEIMEEHNVMLTTKDFCKDESLSFTEPAKQQQYQPLTSDSESR